MKTIILLLLCTPAFSQTTKHIYGIERLRMIKDSVTFTGKVIYVAREKDGDLHFNLKVNDSTTVVCECICQERVPIAKVKTACKGYYKKFKRPRVGSSYKVTGYYAWDKKHKWYELHPVYKIKKLSLTK